MTNDKNSESSEYIDDVGEKFSGAKKDLGIAYNFKQNSLSDLTTKRKLWERPDFRDDVKGGLNTPKHAILFLVIYDNLSSKPIGDGWFKLSAWQWEQAYIKSITFLKNAYENGHYECIEVLTKEFNAYIKSIYPNTPKDIEKYAAGKTTSRKVTHPLTLNKEARLRIECLEALGWLEDELVLDTDNYGACLLSDTRTNKKSWYAVKSATAKTVSTLDGWTEFKTFDEAMAQSKKIFEAEILVERRKQPKKTNERSKPPKRPCFDRPFIRQGPDYRRGEPVTLEQFVDTFKFRGVEFGNWVTQAERQGFLDATYDSFRDLARIFELPPSFASLGGTLGIAFGSRGKGNNVSAHFERGQWLIHLTKTKGTGALCHEFAHALDAYLAKRNMTGTNFLTDRFIRSVHGSRSYILGDLYEIKDLKDQRMMPNLESLLHNIILKNGMKESKSMSNYSSNAAKLDGQNKKLYWADPAELFARAFESWMSDCLVEEGSINEFLVYGTDQSPSSWNSKISMYPESKEREKITAAMDEWIKALVASWKKPIKN